MTFFTDDTYKFEAPVELEGNDELLETFLLEALPQDFDELGTIEDSATSAIELPHHSQLKPEYKGMYVRYGSSCSNQHFGTEAAVKIAMNIAYNWWKKNKSPTVLLGDISAKNFSQTGCHTAHKNGRHLDIDLSKTLPGDPNYNIDSKKKCAVLCWFAIQLGARRVLFSDSQVAQAVNKAAQDGGFSGRVTVRADHDDHFHIEV